MESFSCIQCSYARASVVLLSPIMKEFTCQINVQSQLLLNYFTLMSQDVSVWHTLALAFQTLGVVYGDMGTSPLYVYSDVFSKVQIETEIDVLGALSLVMYTITLIPLAKYVFVVLKANDNGEG